MNRCEYFKQLTNVESKENELFNNCEFDKYATEINEFSRGRNRILFTKSFRRLKQKAQMYSNDKGDHFRTRLTHTLEVAQIARNLARHLHLDEDLTEAIAIGHDIGHAPFGHQGERTLNKIMSGSDDLGGKIKKNYDHGGFKHNYNSLRILTVIEKNFRDETSLISNWQILEGILKHTKLKEKININKFVNPEFQQKYLCLEKNFSVTLEGQIVDIADEIAQRQHDLDDCIRDDLSNLKNGDVFNKLIDIIEQIINEYENIIKYDYDGDKDYLENCIELMKKLKEILEKNKGNEKILIKGILEYFILDVLGTSMNTIQNEKNNYKYSLCWNNVCEKISDEFNNDFCDIGLIGNKEICKFVHIDTDEKSSKIMIDKNNKIATLKNSDGRTYYFTTEKDNDKFNIYISVFKKKIIRFSDVARKFNNEIEKLIRDEILVSDQLNKFDEKAKYIIQRLFNAYYENPLQMPNRYQKILKKRIDDNAKIYELILKKDKRILKEIDIIHGNKKIIEDVFSILKLDIKGKLIMPEGFNDSILDDVDELDRINKIKRDKITLQEEKFIKCLLENNYAYLSTICDYIAGMTDDYAKKEYKELYL